MLYSDFIFWLYQQTPETQKWTILGIIAEFVVLLIIGGIADFIKRKKKNNVGTCRN